MKKNIIKPNALIFAPLPPPVGGIASIANMLKIGFERHDDIIFRQPVGKDKNRLSRSIINFSNIVRYTFFIKPNGSVLLFSSSGFSFYEKLIWSYFIMFFGRKVALIMVDGKFPMFYEPKPYWKKSIISKILANDRLTLGAQSNAWANFYSRCFPKVSVQVVAASVDNSFQEASKRFFLDKNIVLKLIYIGWVIPEKGILDLLDAVLISSKSNDNFKLELVGPLFGKDDYWAKQVEKRGIKDKVSFLGAITNKENLIKKLLESDIFVFPSHYEGMPVSVIEAVTIGIPCIATNVGGIPDILNYGKAGILVPSRNPEQLASGINKLIEDANLRRNLSIEAREWSKMSFSFEALIYSYKKLLLIK